MLPAKAARPMVTVNLGRGAKGRGPAAGETGPPAPLPPRLLCDMAAAAPEAVAR